MTTRLAVGIEEHHGCVNVPWFVITTIEMEFYSVFTVSSLLQVTTAVFRDKRRTYLTVFDLAAILPLGNRSFPLNQQMIRQDSYV